MMLSIGFCWHVQGIWSMPSDINMCCRYFYAAPLLWKLPAHSENVRRNHIPRTTTFCSYLRLCCLNSTNSSNLFKFQIHSHGTLSKGLQFTWFCGFDGLWSLRSDYASLLEHSCRMAWNLTTCLFDLNAVKLHMKMCDVVTLLCLMILQARRWRVLVQIHMSSAWSQNGCPLL